MSKIKYYVGVVIAIISGGLYASEVYLDMGILTGLSIDILSPDIDVTNMETIIGLDDEFTIDGATCSDNLDTECTVYLVSAPDTSAIGEQTVTLVAADTSGNETTLEVTITIGDLQAPIINTSALLTGAVKNSLYNTALVTCTDNVDEECTVVIEGTIDTSILGEQYLTFKATDASGNKTEEVFTVTIVDGIDPSLYIPSGYYDALDGLSDDALVNMLNDIITGHTEFDYTHSTRTDVWDILWEADEDPENEDNVILFYTGLSIPKTCQQSNSIPEECNLELSDGYGGFLTKGFQWNREHIWSKSRGDFEHEDGSSAYAKGAHTDIHHLVAAERNMNSTKNNRHFEDCHDGDDTNIVDRGYGNYTCNDWEFEPRDEVKGDVARMIFYMAIRYEGEEGDYVDLEVVNDPDSTKSSKVAEYGDLDDLLRWHLDDPVDEWEINRNNIIYSYQNNRNPFIDMPELAEIIWGKPEDYN